MEPVRVPTDAAEMIQRLDWMASDAKGKCQVVYNAVRFALGVPDGWVLTRVGDVWAFHPPPEAGKES